MGLNSVWVQDKEKKFNLSEVLKVSPLSQNIDNSLRQKQLGIFKVDKRLREREGIEPDRKQVSEPDDQGNLKLLNDYIFNF